MLDRGKTAFVLIDVQGKLASLMFDSQALIARLDQLIRGIRRLEVPVIWVEQLPDKLGPTVSELEDALSGLNPICKNSFSCAGSSEFNASLNRLGAENIVLAGIESHVCVYQTASDLLNQNYQVQIVADAISSRTPQNRQIGLDRMISEGARITSVEMLLFDLQRIAEGPVFKDIIRLVK
jgi:nicotinamidase-related amidase